MRVRVCACTSSLLCVGGVCLRPVTTPQCYSTSYTGDERCVHVCVCACLVRLLFLVVYSSCDLTAAKQATRAY